MLGYSELLLANHGPGIPDRDDLQGIQASGRGGLTHQLLALGRTQMLVPIEFDLNHTLTALRPMLRRVVREDIELAIEPAPAPAIVRIDPGQFEQAVLNLVLNARDALPAGGRIVLRLERLAIDPADVDAGRRVPPGEYVRLCVRDNGVGMSTEVLAHLFEPVFTTKEFGSARGLGLASTHGIVRQSNGYITVESAPGAGSTFSLYLPAVGGDVRPETAATGEDAQPATILLVEDEDAVRAVIGAVLRHNGYRVLEASTPRHAMEIFWQHGAEIALLLTDIVMPEMNGPALAQRLVAVRPELRVLFISGYTDVAARAFDPENPNTTFLGKPFHASALIDRVRDLLGRPRSGGIAR